MDDEEKKLFLAELGLERSGLDRLIRELAGGDSYLLKPEAMEKLDQYAGDAAVLERLAPYFSLSILYYNPNISPEGEFVKRAEELKRLLSQMEFPHPVELLPLSYRGEDFQQAAQGLEGEPEGGARCLKCYRLRLEEAARAARDGGFDYFTTTLSISPLKNAKALNEIGEELGRQYGVAHLPADFKKKEGYKRSILLSREYRLYRQDYCGCVYSRLERERQKQQGKKGEED